MITRRRFVKVASAGAASLLCAPLLGGCGAASGSGGMAASSAAASEDGLRSAVAFDFDTMVSIEAACGQETLDAAVARCDYFEGIFSRTIPTSDIGRINAAAGSPVEVAPETAEVLSRAVEWSRATDGRFDVSIGAVTELWDFKEGIKPDEGALERAASHVNWENIRIEGQTVTLLDPDMRLDLGGIAKGYIADDLARLLSEAGCESALINLGGNVLAVGSRPDGSPWQVGIADPAGSGDVLENVSLAGEGVSTSGTHERCFTLDGVFYHHILDPATGLPVETDVASASVRSDLGVAGDCLATSLVQLGGRGALDDARARDDAECLIVREDGSLLRTEGFS